MIYNNFMDTQSFQTELKRKLFHLTGLLYVIGLAYMPRQTYLTALIVLLGIELIAETLRLKHRYIRDWTNRIAGELMREHERDKISGIFWMTFGALGSALIVSETRLAAACMLYLILGDAAASLTGKLLRGQHWPGSPKRLSGSAACFITCVVIGVLVLRPAFGWEFVLIGASVATFSEFNPLKINDNFLIPFTSAVGFFLTSLL